MPPRQSVVSWVNLQVATLVRGEPDAKKNAPQERRVGHSNKNYTIPVGAGLCRSWLASESDLKDAFAGKPAPTTSQRHKVFQDLLPPAQVGEAGAASICAHSSGV
ncbi:hypothetical protein EMIT0P218_50144 [Pseudomonas sp. IT-P218]